MSGAFREIAGVKVCVCEPDGPRLEGDRWPGDFIGDMYVEDAKVIAVPVARLGDGFLTLSTRIAGEVVQKFVNYGIRVVFVGDVSDAVARSDALRDYIREANRGRHVWFVADMAELEARLAAQA